MSNETIQILNQVMNKPSDSTAVDLLTTNGFRDDASTRTVPIVADNQSKVERGAYGGIPGLNDPIKHLIDRGIASPTTVTAGGAI